jgi:hypothetical protein
LNKTTFFLVWTLLRKFSIALLNVLLHEVKIYDADYLKDHTNAPYLIGADGLYLRDAKERIPLVWDPAEFGINLDLQLACEVSR